MATSKLSKLAIEWGEDFVALLADLGPSVDKYAAADEYASLLETAADREAFDAWCYENLDSVTRA